MNQIILLIQHVRGYRPPLRCTAAERTPHIRSCSTCPAAAFAAVSAAAAGAAACTAAAGDAACTAADGAGAEGGAAAGQGRCVAR